MSAPLRVCVIASSRFPVAEPFAGGLEAHTHALTRALREDGHEVSLFAAPGSDPALGAQNLPVASFRSSSSAREDVGWTSETWMAEHHAYLDLMMALAEGRHGRFDVVHNNSLHHIPLAMSRLLPMPLLTTLHTPPLAWLESASRVAGPQVAFTAVSRTVAEAWRDVVDAEVVLNGVDTDRWTPGPGGGPAVWLGRLVPEKAPHEAIDAARSAGLALDLAGPVHDTAYVRAEVEPRLGPDVRYRGHLRGADLRRLVGAASVSLVTPRWAEPFGLVAAESMACGTPVAAWAAGALPEIVEPATGRLVEVGDVAGLGRAALAAAALDRDDVRRRAVARFDQRRMVASYVGLYRRLAGPRAA